VLAAGVAAAVALAGAGGIVRPAAATPSANILRPAFAAGGPIEAAYANDGPATVVWDDGRPAGCPAQPGSAPPPTQPYTFVYPSNLGANGFKHPVIVWGNGTSVDPNADPTCSYRVWLRHLASRGFVVVASNSGQVGGGVELRDAGNLMNLNNVNPFSRFFGKLSTNMAVAGHSQGAVGAINATLNNPGLFDSVFSVGIPNRDVLGTYNTSCLIQPNCRTVPVPARSALGNLRVPVFFARATGLHHPAPCNADDWISNQTARDWYPTSGAAFAAATVKVDLPADPATCSLGGLWPYPHLDTRNVTGYGTAWFHYMAGYTRPGDPVARGAFAGAAPEVRSNANWTGVTLQALP
jgi:hypothetical protein